MSNTTLSGHLTEHLPGGVAVLGITRTFTFEDGTAFEVPIPLLPIGNGLVVAPAMTMNDDKTVTVNLARWCPGITTEGWRRVLGVDFSTQTLAVWCARDFHADRTTSWTDSWPQVLAWLRTWAPANGVTGLDKAEVSAS